MLKKTGIIHFNRVGKEQSSPTRAPPMRRFSVIFHLHRRAHKKQLKYDWQKTNTQKNHKKILQN